MLTVKPKAAEKNMNDATFYYNVVKTEIYYRCWLLQVDIFSQEL